MFTKSTHKICVHKNNNNPHTKTNLSNCAVISLIRFIVDHKLYIFNPCFFATSVYDSFQFDADPRSTLGKNGSRSRFFFLNLLNFFNKLEFSNFLSIFSLIFMLKLDEPSRNKEIFIISLFLNSSDLGFESKHFFCSFWLIFCPGFLDPDSWICIFLRIRIWIQEAKNLRIQRIRIRILSTVCNLECWKVF